MDPVEEVDELWDGLNLGGLLNDLARENESALAQAKKLQAKKDPFKKHKKMLKNPAYSVLMDRYGAAPPKPRLLAKSTLNRLSDPVKGRHLDNESDRSAPRVRVVRDTKYHPRKALKQHGMQSDRHRNTDARRSLAHQDRDPYDHSPIRKEAWGDSSLSPTNKVPRPSATSPIQNIGGDTFFLTETNDEGEDYRDDDFESPPPSPAALRKKMQQTRGPEVSPIELGVVLDSPRGDRPYSPPDIYSPRTKEALRVSFNKEKAAEKALLPPTKTFNPLQFTSNKSLKGTKELKQSATTSTSGPKKVKVLKQKPVKGKSKPTKTKTKKKISSNLTSKGRVAAVSSGRRTRGSSLERQSKPSIRRSTRQSSGNELNFDAPSKRVQLLSNKMHANKASRAGVGGKGGTHSQLVRSGGVGKAKDTLLRSSSVKGIREPANTESVEMSYSSGLGGSRSAPSLNQRNSSGNNLPTMSMTNCSASSSRKPTTLPALRAKNLLGRKGVSPSLQDRYAGILQDSKEACKDDPPPRKKVDKGFEVANSGGRRKKLEPIIEKQRNVNRKMKTRKDNVKRLEESAKSPGKMTEEEKEKKMENERIRREEQEKRIEARAHASKKREEREYRNKIRQAAEENAAKAKKGMTYETVDEKLISMFKTHCARVTTKLSEADKLSADFKALKEFDGYSSADRMKLRPDDNNGILSLSSEKQGYVSDPLAKVMPTGNALEVNSSDAFLSKPLMM